MNIATIRNVRWLALTSLLAGATVVWAGEEVNNEGGQGGTGAAEASAVGISDALAGASAQLLSAPTTSNTNQNLNSNTLQAALGLSQTFQSSRANPPAVTGLAPSVDTPNIFSQPTVPQFGKAVPLALTYFEKCNPVLTGDMELREKHARGVSRHTDVIFLPHPMYHSAGEPDTPVSSVSVHFPQGPEKINCLGMLTVNAQKDDADKVTMYGAINDAQHFVKSNLSGFSDVRLLCAQNAVAVNLGVDAGGVAASISPGGNYVRGNSRSLFSLLAGITGQSAQTFPSAQLGFSCLLATADGDTTIDLAAMNQTLNNMFGNGHNGATTAEKAYGAGEVNNDGG